MKRSHKLLTIIFYFVYAGLWCAISVVVLKNVKYGMFKPFIFYYGIVSVWICAVVATVTLISPLYLLLYPV
jgi:hypothetical protein